MFNLSWLAYGPTQFFIIFFHLLMIISNKACLCGIWNCSLLVLGSAFIYIYIYIYIYIHIYDIWLARIDVSPNKKWKKLWCIIYTVIHIYISKICDLKFFRNILKLIIFFGISTKKKLTIKLSGVDLHHYISNV